MHIAAQRDEASNELEAIEPDLHKEKEENQTELQEELDSSLLVFAESAETDAQIVTTHKAKGSSKLQRQREDSNDDWRDEFGRPLCYEEAKRRRDKDKE